MHFSSTSISTNKTKKSAFTLIELLAVVTVVVILMGIIFGISKGVLNQQARTQARAELAMIAQALEEFKLAYGDYPVIAEDDPVITNANSMELAKALTGYTYLKPGDQPGSRQMADFDTNQIREGFLDADSVNFSIPFRDPDNESRVPNSADDFDSGDGRIYLVDPWRQPYVYLYNRGSSSNSWDNPGYVLFSKGPDREAADLNLTTGILGPSDPGNVNNDNVYPNQQ